MRDPTPEEAKQTPIPTYEPIVPNATLHSKLPCPDGCDVQVLPDALICRATGKKQGWVSSVRQGPAIYFHKNGKKRSEGSYSNNESEGVWWSWDEAGNLTSYEEYKQGKVEGLWVEFHPDGKRKTEHHMKAGKLDGTSKRWNPNGKLESISEMAGDNTVSTVVFPQNMPGPASSAEVKAMEEDLQRLLEEQRKLLGK
jgi:hypothetical protein